jgi:hypothetical protein
VGRVTDSSNICSPGIICTPAGEPPICAIDADCVALGLGSICIKGCDPCPGNVGCSDTCESGLSQERRAELEARGLVVLTVPGSG